MLNYSQSGDTISYALQSGESVSSGDLFPIGHGQFGVAQTDGSNANGDTVAFVLKGVFDLAITAGDEGEAGDPMYYDAAVGGVSVAVSSGALVGYLVAPLSAADTEASVILIGAGQSKAYQEMVAVLDASSGVGIGTQAFGPELPEGALIVDSHILVDDTFTSATDAATIALGHADDASGIDAAIAISNAANPWDSGEFREGDGPLQPTTARRQLLATVAVEALTAGKLVVVARYIMS